MFLNNAVIQIFQRAQQRLAETLTSRVPNNVSLGYHRYLSEVQHDLLKHAAAIEKLDPDQARWLRDFARNMSLGGPDTPLHDKPRPDLPPIRFNTDLGIEVDQIASLSPTLTERISRCQGEGWTFEYNTAPVDEVRHFPDPDAGFPRGRVIRVSTVAEKHPAVAVSHLASLVERALREPFSGISPAGVTETDYITHSRNAMLRPLAEGVYTGVLARREILQTTEIDIGLPYANAEFYQRMVGKVDSGVLTESQAVDRIAFRLKQEQLPSGETFGAYYRRLYAGEWREFHHPSA